MMRKRVWMRVIIMMRIMSWRRRKYDPKLFYNEGDDDDEDKEDKEE